MRRPAVAKHILQDYIDLDVAYLLGLIVSRGTFREHGDERTLLLEFPYGSMTVDGIETQYDQQIHLRLAIGEIKNRLYELLFTDIQDTYSASSVQLAVRFTRNTMAWRNLRLITQGKSNYWEFEVPSQVEQASADIQKEFLRGIADACGHIRQSNNYMGARRRVYLEIHNRNWHLPVQICRLLQCQLGVAAQLIQWGHPNTREPNNPNCGNAWAREHQVKIFSDAFEPVDFHVEYKRRVLAEFIADDRERFNVVSLPCNPKMKRIRSRKPAHPEENSPLLPEYLRGQHFDAYWQICRKLGCRQGQKIGRQIAFFEEEVEDVS